MVMLFNASRRSDDRSGPYQGPFEGPFEGLGDDGGDHSDHSDQGEVVVLPFQFVVSPDYGRFHPASLPLATNGTLMLAPGTLVGEVRNGPTKLAVHSPFAGQVDAWLVSAGQIVIPGQPVCSLRSLRSLRLEATAAAAAAAAGAAGTAGAAGAAGTGCTGGGP
jgi:hypothetical protein